MESSKSNRWHGGSCCEASLRWRPSGPCWPPLSTCAPCGGPGAPAPSSSYHTGQISIPLPDPNCAGNHPSPIHPHLQLSRQESFSKSHRLNPSAPTCYPLHHFWDRLSSLGYRPPAPQTILPNNGLNCEVIPGTITGGRSAPMMERAEETTGTKAQTTLADAGYFAGSHLEECASRGQQVVVSESRQRFLKDPYHKDQFTYDEQSDSFTCPEGQTLHFVRIQHANGVPLRLYRASGAVCQACPAFGACTRARKIGRSLAIGPHDAVLRRHRAWMATSAAKEAYRLRKQLVEPVFGIIKEQQMARRFLLRGLVNVAAEWTMLATAFNLRTLWRAWRSRAFIQLPHGPNLHPAS